MIPMGLFIAVAIIIGALLFGSAPNHHGAPRPEETELPEVNQALFGCSSIVWLALIVFFIVLVASAFGVIDPTMEPPVKF